MRLLVVPSEGEPFALELDEGSIVVGRSSTAHLALADPRASRHHARLTRRGATLLVEDLGARNGTFINERRVVGPQEVLSGDVIRIAGSSIRRVEEGEPVSDLIGDSVEMSEAIDSTISRSAAEILEDSSEVIEARKGELALRRYVRRLETLRDIHRALSRATTRADLLRSTLDLAFELFSPWHGAIYLRASDGELRRADGRPTPAPADAQLPEPLVSQVLRDKMAVAAQIQTLEADTGSAASSRSVAAAPLLDGEDCFGMIVLWRDGQASAFVEEQLDLVTELAGEAVLEIKRIALIEEAGQRRLYEHELTLARRIQLSILPGELPSFEGYSFFGRNIPSRGVSGDFYSLTLRRAGDECLLFLGDVSGKGLSAALVTASVEALSAAMIQAGDPPDAICSELSRQLFERTLDSVFVTAFVASLDRQSGRLVYTNAGSNSALLARPDGSLETLESFGFPLAMMGESAYVSREILLEPGATLLLYTDGITEAANGEDEQYGIERLTTSLGRHRGRSLEEVFDAIQADLDGFVGAVPYADDRTVLMVRRSAAT